jgi:hypothetical protein
MTVGLALGVSVFAGLILILGAHLILGFFGANYAAQASWSLRILAVGSFPLIIKYHYLAIHRIKDRVSKAIVPITVGSILEIVMAIVGTHFYGLSGLSLGWVAGMYIEAIIMGPTVIRTLRGIDIPVMGVLDDWSPQLDGFGSSLEQSITISMKLMAIESPVDIMRSISFIDAPTIKLKKIQLYDSDDDDDDDMTSPTTKMSKVYLSKVARADKDLAKKNLPDTAVSEDQFDDFMNAPTVKMRRIKKPLSSDSNEPVLVSSKPKPIKKMRVERIDTIERPGVRGAPTPEEVEEEVNT